MNWLLRRIVKAVLAVLIGSLLGLTLGGPAGFPMVGVVLGSTLMVAALTVTDAWRGRRLMRWLRGPQESPAPRDKGFWGEIGYRIERSLRTRERLLAQEQMRLAQFLSAIEVSPNGVLLLDANEEIEWCNSVAADHLGLDPVRDRRQPITNLVRSPAFVAYLQAGRYDAPVQIPQPRSRGTLAIIIRRYGEGMRLLISQDITELERADAMRRDFVANVSHEIRTPLTVLAGFIESMGNLNLSEAERVRVLELMRQQASRMQSLVGDLLTLAQLEGSPWPAADRWVPVARLFRQAEADAAALSAGRHALRFNDPGAAQLAGSESELLSAVANLVNNAVRYTPEGGMVQVQWSVRGDGSGEIEVRDNGIGISREHLPRLVERFYRVDGSRSRDTGGTGLGLSIVKHVVQRHSGELDIQSEPGQGSSFRLVFPAARVRHAASGPNPQASTAATHSHIG